ncbi:MAG: hypothetical protein J5659_03195 [Clostridia bacterium]|nr:hypothetical protein [Clostridia bacterium]
MQLFGAMGFMWHICIVLIIAATLLLITIIICKTVKEVHSIKSKERIKIYEMRKKDAEKIGSNNNVEGNSEK